MLRFKTGFSPLISASELTKEAGSRERCEESQVWGYSQRIKWSKFLWLFPLSLDSRLHYFVNTIDLFIVSTLLVKLV